jgi:hypothetical protein
MGCVQHTSIDRQWICVLRCPGTSCCSVQLGATWTLGELLRQHNCITRGTAHGAANLPSRMLSARGASAGAPTAEAIWRTRRGRRIIHKRASAILTCPRGLVLPGTLSQSTQLVSTTNSPCCNARQGQDSGWSPLIASEASNTPACCGANTEVQPTTRSPSHVKTMPSSAMSFEI